MSNDFTLPEPSDGQITPTPEAPTSARFDFDAEIKAYERNERRWAVRKSAANFTLDEHVAAAARRHERNWTRGLNLAESTDFRVDGQRLDQLINAALNLEVGLGRHRALCELDFADYYDAADDLAALDAHCKRFDRRVIVVRRVEGATEYLDRARSDLILSLLLELRNWRKLARKIGREVRDQYDRTETVRAEIVEHDHQYFKDWCRERDENDDSAGLAASEDANA